MVIEMIIPRLPEMIIPRAPAREDQDTVFSRSERGSSRARVPSTSQDLVPERSGLLTLSNVQIVLTHNLISSTAKHGPRVRSKSV
jgi:hypothetical protein